VAFVDVGRIYLKARVGMEDVPEIPIVDRDSTFCIHTITTDSLLVVPDALEDDRFRCNALVMSEPKIRFYAGAPLITPAGHRLGNLCVIDMTPRHLEPQQLQALEKLARQVSAQLELRLSLAAVRQQNRQLEKLSEEKSRFLSAVSHDIRQPLATVMMCSELMVNDEEELLAEPHAELASTAYSCAQFMHNLVDELLQMVEFDFGKVPVPLECRMTDLVSLVHRVVATNSLYARPKHITLRLGVDTASTSSPVPRKLHHQANSNINTSSSSSALVPVSGGQVVPYEEWQLSRGPRAKINCNLDPVKIEQVLNNFISNAIKFSHANSCIDIVIGRADTTDAEGCRVRGRCASVSVIDRGQGIPREEMGKLFQPFQRLSVKPTGGETSTGLGLAITRNIILAHSGDVQVESTQGEGSTFRMLLPLPTRADLLAIEPAVATPQLQRRPSLGGVRRPLAKTAFKVLVADDNGINLRLMKQILQRRGHEVWTASDGKEALEVFHEMGGHEHFHVLLIDEEMPHMCGVEVMGHIRDHEAERQLGRRMPLVSVSGHADSEHRRVIQAAGGDDVCAKPFNAEKLLELVERLATQYQLASLELKSVATAIPVVANSDVAAAPTTPPHHLHIF
jgi:signal transduction histidine kinase/FixJ family two-component response regulator